jgi:hypothetical protein
MTSTAVIRPSTEDQTDRELELERSLAKHIILAMLVAVPVMVVFWVGLVALAVSFSGAGYAAPLAMGAGVGVLAGVFWGAWAGFTMAMPELDEYEHETISASPAPAEQPRDGRATTLPRTGNSESP